MKKTPSSEPILRSRLLPQISFRFLMSMTALVAVLLTIGRSAGSGLPVARALLVALAFPAALLLLGSALFLLSWIVASLTLRPGASGLRSSPFAENQLPPQTLPPRDRAS